MKVQFAYTPDAIYTGTLTLPANNTWYAIDGTPFMFYQSTTGVFNRSGNEMYINTGWTYIAAKTWDLLESLTEDEVLTFGVRMRYTSSASTRSGENFTGIWMGPTTEYYPITQAEIDANLSSDGIAYVEVSVDPVARTLTGYVNGRKTRTVAIPAGVSYKTVNPVFTRKMGQAVVYYLRDFYCAVFKKSEGPTIMGAWSCEDLVELNSELRDGDGNLTRNTVNETFKTITYKAPAPGATIGADIKAINPNEASKLIAVVSDGKTTSTKELLGINTKYLLPTPQWGKSNMGWPLGGVTMTPDANQVTVKLKAQYFQE